MPTSAVASNTAQPAATARSDDGPPPSAPVFLARGLTKIYRSGDLEVRALRELDMELYAGELLVLLGASGSGKSTLLNILGGLDTATSGTVRFEDHDLTSMNQRELTQYRRDHIGFVFQFYNLIPSLTARENVALVTEIARDPMRPDDALRWSDSAIAWITFLRNCPAASSNASRSPAPSPSARTYSSATNQPERSTSRRGAWYFAR